MIKAIIREIAIFMAIVAVSYAFFWHALNVYFGD